MDFMNAIFFRMTRMNEVGVTSRIIDDYFEDMWKLNEIDSKHFKNIDLKLLIIPYCILFVGFLLAIFIFIIENLIYI